MGSRFDKVPHKRLLTKLDYYGVRGNILAWIGEFLSSRSQKVLVVNGKDSTEARVLSGIPQGTVLGPFLFLAYINDIPEQISPGTKLDYMLTTVCYTEESVTILTQPPCKMILTCFRSGKTNGL